MASKFALAAPVVLLVGLLLGHTALAGSRSLQQAQEAAQSQQYAQAQGLLRDWLRDHPHDGSARFLLARVLSWQKKYGEAYIEYDHLLNAAPENVDYLLGKARTLMWDGRPLEALPLLEHAHRLRPDYQDVWRAEIDALLAAAGEGQRQKALSLSKEAQARFPQADWNGAVSLTPREVIVNPLVPTRVADRPTQLEAGITYEGLSNGYDDWRSVYLWADHTYGKRKVVYGGVRETQRYALRDLEAHAGVSYPLTEQWMATLEASASPDHNVLPKWALFGELGYVYKDGWGMTAGLSQTQYGSARSDSGRLGVERYVGNYRLAYTASFARLEGNGSATTHKAQANYYYGAHNNLGIAVVTGQEVNSDPAGVVTTDVRSAILNGIHWFLPRWAISYELLVHRQGDSYTRKGAKVGLRHNF